MSDPKQNTPIPPGTKVTRLPAGKARGLEPVTVGDLFYAQHNAGPDFKQPTKKKDDPQCPST